MAINIKESRENSIVELEKTLRDRREALLKARLGKQTGQLEKPHLLREYRRDIACISTLITEKKQSAALA